MITRNDAKPCLDHEYKGLSTDTKPTDCGVNSLYLELDTDDFYYFDGENWQKVGGGGGGGGGSGVMNQPLTLTITNNSSGNIYPPGSIFVKDNVIVEMIVGEIVPDETETVSIIVPVFESGGQLPEDGKAILALYDNYQVSNTVNCHTTEFNGDPAIEIDDVTKPSSADIIVVEADD